MYKGPQQWLYILVDHKIDDQIQQCGYESTLMTMERQRWPVNEWISSASRKAVYHSLVTTFKVRETLSLRVGI